MGSKNHELVPTSLVVQLSGLRSGSGVHKSISTLAKIGLIARMKNAKYDGYRLTYGGLDHLALHTHLQQKTLYSTGPCIGAGKESDIYLCCTPHGTQQILKIHRLGRISFRSIKNSRDYLRHRTAASWMYMSRLAAQREWLFMQVLWREGFRVPEPLGWGRHTVVMGLIEGVPLRECRRLVEWEVEGLYGELMEMVAKLASYGLIHGDFNEFNIMIKEEEAPEALKADNWIVEDLETEPEAPPPADPDTPTRPSNPTFATSIAPNTSNMTPILIDFPQTVSIDHPNAAFYFDRDVTCIKKFFQRRFYFTSSEPGPFFVDARKLAGTGGRKRLDVEVEASGFSRKMAKELEKYREKVGIGADGDGNGGCGGERLEDEIHDQYEDEGEDVLEDGTETASRSGQVGVNKGNGELPGITPPNLQSLPLDR